MNKFCLRTLITVFGVSLMLGAFIPLTANNSNNSARNKSKEVTAGDQSNNYPDLQMTRKIRREIMDDESLSMEARNIKIISRNGHVTLNGSVANEFEKTRIEQITRDTVGLKNFTSLIMVATNK